MIQCVNNPKLFYKKIFKLSKNKSKILIGDIPNINKKFRFISSEFGRKFEAKRLKKKVVIKNFSKFLAETKQNKLVNDKFVNFIFNHSRKNLRNCFVIKQPKKLPFSYTREDIILKDYKMFLSTWPNQLNTILNKKKINKNIFKVLKISCKTIQFKILCPCSFGKIRNCTFFYL